MDFKTRFDELIFFIENNISKSNTEIMVLVKDKFAYGDPSYLAHAFDYITGMRLKEYIIRRKLIHIFNYKKNNNCTIEDAVSKFEYSSETNFMRDFKKYYNTTVTKMTDEESKIASEPLYVKTILEMEGKLVMARTLTTPEPKLFDIPVSQLTKIKEAISLMEFYNFEADEAEVAYQLTKNTSLNVESIFGFCSDYFDHIEHIKKRYADAKIENLAILCIKLDVCVREGLEMMIEIDENITVEDYGKIPDVAWDIIADENQPEIYYTHPHLVLYIINEMKKANIPLSEIYDVFEHLESYECIKDGIEDYANGEDIYDDIYDDSKEYMENSYIRFQEYEDIEATFTKDYLGY